MSGSFSLGDDCGEENLCCERSGSPDGDDLGVDACFKSGRNVLESGVRDLLSGVCVWLCGVDGAVEEACDEASDFLSVPLGVEGAEV